MMAAVQSLDPGYPVILVVEDEALISEILCEVLQSEGLNTVAKPDADQALLYLSHSAPGVALILTDVNMPGSINGAALANHALTQWPAIPIIAMSGLETSETAGIDCRVAFIQKPFALSEMLLIVKTALALH